MNRDNIRKKLRLILESLHFLYVPEKCFIREKIVILCKKRIPF